jgi:hypothetical protein
MAEFPRLDDENYDSFDVELDNNMEVLLLESLSGSTTGSPTAGSTTAAPPPTIQASEDSDEEAQFDLMQIYVTVYSLTGVVSITNRRLDPAASTMRRFKQAGRKKTTKSGSNSSSIGLATFDDYSHDETRGAVTSSRSTPAGTSFATGESYGLVPDEPPTTAVVSFMRNAISSQQSLETFLPSLPLRQESKCRTRTLLYSASWSKGPQWNVLDQAANHPSTFPMVRVMKQQAYKSGTGVGEVSAYVHETVELCVFAGRSKELIPLGVASIIVTGDEEVEHVLNLPVKQPKAGTSLFDKHFKVSKKKRSKKKAGSFSHNRRQRFELEDNATLRVGVRVLPQHALRQAKQRAHVHKEKEDRAMEQILESFMNDNLIGDLTRDDDSLLRRIASNQRERRQQETDQKIEVARKSCETPQQMATAWPNIFCGAPFYPPSAMAQTRAAAAAAGQMPNWVVALNEEKNDNDTLENPIVLPLSLVSSVSETITTVGSHTPTHD